MSQSSHPFRGRRAFTLVEVTISVALGLVLMLGIAQVFRVSGDAIGTGQALAGALANSRAAQTVFTRDLNGAVRDGAPYMVLDANQVFAFRNRADLLSDKDGFAYTQDLTGSGTETTIKPYFYGTRSHRTDLFNFFSRGSFQRQTGAQFVTGLNTSPTPFIAPMSTNEAYVWYGHLDLPANNNNFVAGSTTSPGAALATNPNNYFADDWAIGRVQMLLSLPSTIAPNGVATASQISDSNGNEQYAYATTPAASANTTSPFAYDTAINRSSNRTSNLLLDTGIGTTTAQFRCPRIDLAETSIATYYSQILSIASPISTSYSSAWFSKLMDSNTTRFWAFPVMSTRPITPQTVAYVVPILARSCTQFVVDYAGDYLNQDSSTGAVTDTYVHVPSSDVPPNFSGLPPTGGPPTAGTTDGLIDYVPVTGSGNTMTKKIRWYGLPRSTSGNSTITYANGDVVPLRDLWVSAPGGTAVVGVSAPFEISAALPTKFADYSTTTGTAGKEYQCVWGPTDRKPKMIRITMTLDDPQGRLGEGQTYEYIFTLP